MPAAASIARDLQRCGEPVDRGFRRLGVERALAAHEGGGIEIAEHDIGVGHGRLPCRPGRSRPAPASRPRFAGRHGRCRRRRREAIEPPPAAMLAMSRLRSAMRSPARPPSADSVDAAVGDQRNVGRGAAHVEGDEIGNAEHVGAAPAAGHAARRARQHGRRREPRGLLHRRHAAMGEDDEERALEAGFDRAAAPAAPDNAARSAAT